jgi:hypothetical protein
MLLHIVIVVACCCCVVFYYIIYPFLVVSLHYRITYILTARTKTSKNAIILRSATNQKRYNLRKRNPQAAESGNETSSSGSLSVANKTSSNLRKSPRIVKGDNETSKNASVLKSVAKIPKSYNLRRSPRFVESGNETSNVSEEKIVTKKTQKTVVTEKKNESNRKSSGVDRHKPKRQALKQSAYTPSFLSCDQEKDVKKPKGEVFII